MFLNATLTKVLIALVPTAMLVAGSTSVFLRLRTISSFLQFVGANGFVVVVLAHLCEALHLFPSMKWGLEDSAGHYLDLAGALVGVTFFPIGYLAFAISSRGAFPLKSDSTSP